MSSATQYPTLRKLTVREGEPVQEIIQSNLSELSGMNESAIVQFRISGVPGGQSTQTYTIALTPSGAHLQTQSAVRPNLAVIVSHDTFVSMANGTYSPLQACIEGKLRPLGDVELGKRIAAKLAPSDPFGGSFGSGVCPMISTESWTYNGNGFGTLTLSGIFFTSGGDVAINFITTGGSLAPRVVIADAVNGTWTISQEILCGEGPVLIQAEDAATGKIVSKSYPTPCG